MQCPKCGSDVYDNRPKKLSGAFKANAPDFKCQKKSCDWVQWPPKDQPPAPIVPPSAPQAQPGASSSHFGRDAQIINLFWDSFDNVLEGIAKRRLVESFRSENIASLVATQFIQRVKG